ncbi:hypothetical protein ACFRCI_39645 [Streptomyces sp. NPDC056638]|uniref:hypothetical protein n=1 Tax=Streptomyces sp. NPDC056638 TaxID=3345887 RepID=UPI0036C47A8E
MLFETPRELRGVSSKAPPLDPQLSASLSARAARIAELRGWPPRTLGSVRRGIRILCAVHRPGERIRASTITQLTHTAVPANHVLEVFEELEIFLDDRPDTLDAWCEEHLSFLSSDVRTEHQRSGRIGSGAGTEHPLILSFTPQGAVAGPPG